MDSGQQVFIRISFAPLQSSYAPAPGPAGSNGISSGGSNAYAPGPSTGGNSNNNSGGGGGFGPDTSGANYQTVIVGVQYDPGTAALLGDVVGNLSNTIMAGTNLTVRPPARPLLRGCTALRVLA